MPLFKRPKRELTKLELIAQAQEYIKFKKDVFDLFFMNDGFNAGCSVSSMLKVRYEELAKEIARTNNLLYIELLKRSDLTDTERMSVAEEAKNNYGFTHIV